MSMLYLMALKTRICFGDITCGGFLRTESEGKIIGKLSLYQNKVCSRYLVVGKFSLGINQKPINPLGFKLEPLFS